MADRRAMDEREGTTLTEPASLQASVTVEAPPEEVWVALTVPSMIKRWFFGVDTETDWRVGSPITHRGVYRGESYEDEGTVIEFAPPDRLVHSHWSPVSGKPDRAEHYQIVTWELVPIGNATEVTVTEDNLPTDEAKLASERGWESALDGLRRMFEARG